LTQYNKPTERVVVIGDFVLDKEFKIETATNMYPRRLVKRGSADGLIVVGTAGCTPLGVLGFEECHELHRPKDANGKFSIDAIYAVNAKVPVHRGQKIVTLILSTDSVVEGDALVAGADGKVRKAVAISIPSGGTQVTSTSANPTLLGSLPAAGPVVAFAEEAQDASGSDKVLMARWVLG